MIAVLGASGFIGKHLVASLDSRELVFTYNSSPLESGLHFDVTKMSLRELDIAWSKISHCLILLGETQIDFCKLHEEESSRTNIQGIVGVLEELFELGVKPIFSSTDYVFDGEKGNYIESCPTSACTVYGKQKVAIEEYLEASGRDFLILRFPKTLGTVPGDGSLLSNWLAALENGASVPCAMEQRFSVTHVRDIVEGILITVEKDLSGIYHLCAPESFNRAELVIMLASHLGVKPNIFECSTDYFAFADNRSKDVSMIPDKFIEATGKTFRSMDSCCKEITEKYRSSR